MAQDIFVGDWNNCGARWRWHILYYPICGITVLYYPSWGITVLLQFFLGECTLPVDNQYKYLGVILNEFVNFNLTADNLSGAANSALRQ